MVKINQKNSPVFLWYLVIGMILFSCKGEDIYYQQFQEIKRAQWDMSNPVSFEFDISDTTAIYDFSFNLRNTKEYGYSNLFIFWELKSPDGRIKTDTSEFILAKPSGEWLGKSVSGTVIENSMVFLRKKLPAQGAYTYTFTQGMREAELNGIKDVGLKIKKYNE